MIECAKCHSKASSKDHVWVWSGPLHGYGETPELCGKCHDKIFPLIKEMFKKWIEEQI